MSPRPAGVPLAEMETDATPGTVSRRTHPVIRPAARLGEYLALLLRGSVPDQPVAVGD
jgi:hypothetical protein